MLKIKRWPCNEVHKDPNLECEICEVIPYGVVIKPSDWPPEAREILRAANLKDREQRAQKPLPVTPNSSISISKTLEDSLAPEATAAIEENKENISVQVSQQGPKLDAGESSSAVVPHTPEKKQIYSPTPSLTSIPSPSSVSIMTATAMSIKKVELDDIEVLHYIPTHPDKEREQNNTKLKNDKGKGKAQPDYQKKESHQDHHEGKGRHRGQKVNERPEQLKSQDRQMRKSQGHTARAQIQSLQHEKARIDKENRANSETYAAYKRSVSMPEPHRESKPRPMLQIPPTDRRAGKTLPTPTSPGRASRHQTPTKKPGFFATNQYYQSGRPSVSTSALATSRQESAANKPANLPEPATAHRQASYGDYLTVPRRPQHDLRRARSPSPAGSRPRTSLGPRPGVSAPGPSRPITALGQRPDMPLGTRPETSMASISTHSSSNPTSDQDGDRRIGKLKRFFRKF
ncbi:hypothetical protein Dda_3763 [Drechslerella dactyloides]|uniref:Uncharacterized protein n=1 Tax=Drechslerella dactyloides TaxID=74499 RepID=A0AAD6NLF8_DREDA|nr:hypothetical protein Dda_3763 [Drechslerella dactyloides]